MTDYNAGKIHGWNGGECPVHSKSVVRYWLRNGTVNIAVANAIGWKLDKVWPEYDIIAYQVVTPYIEPKTIWVNESEGIIYGAYLSEEAARRTTYPNTTRVAVKYQEVIEND